jgi:hypothetical protein
MFDPGSVYVTRKLTIGFAKNGVETKRSLGRQRIVEREFYETLPFIKWTRADQAEAIKRGYFLERSRADNHVIVIPLPRDLFSSDADVMREAMRRAREGEAHAVKLITFVLQQDQRGWSGTWESPTIETYRPSLIWYKEHVRGERPTPRGESRNGRYQPTGRSRGRPRGTVAEHALRRDLQMKEYNASGTALPYADWCKTQNYRP